MWRKILFPQNTLKVRAQKNFFLNHNVLKLDQFLKQKPQLVKTKVKLNNQLFKKGFEQRLTDYFKVGDA